MHAIYEKCSHEVLPDRLFESQGFEYNYAEHDKLSNVCVPAT